MRRLRIGGKTLRVRDEPEPAPDAQRAPVPLVCVHGAGMSSVVWMDAVRRLALARRVIAVDLPGHGQSEGEPAAAATRIDTYRDAVGAVCTHLGLGRVVLVGHSMGGAVALAAALAWPERVAGLVLVNSAAALPVTPELLDSLAQALPSEAGPEAEPVWVDRLPSELASWFFSPATHKDVRERWQAVLLAASRQTVLGDFQACGHFDVTARLGELKLPTLLIGGQDDLLVTPQALTATAAKLAGAKLQLVPDTAHLTHLEQPEKFFGLLGEFLGGVA